MTISKMNSVFKIMIRFLVALWCLAMIWSVWRLALEFSAQQRLDDELSAMEKFVDHTPTAEDFAKFGEPLAKGITFGSPHPDCSMTHVMVDTEFRAGTMYRDEKGKVVAVSRRTATRLDLLCDYRLGGVPIWREYVARDGGSPLLVLRSCLYRFCWEIPIGCLLLYLTRITGGKSSPNSRPQPFAVG